MRSFIVHSAVAALLFALPAISEKISFPPSSRGVPYMLTPYPEVLYLKSYMNADNKDDDVGGMDFADMRVYTPLGFQCNEGSGERGPMCDGIENSAEHEVFNVMTFSVSEACGRGLSSCSDWVASGVGTVDDDGEYHVCCTTDVLARGGCLTDEYPSVNGVGKPILDTAKFTEHQGEVWKEQVTPSTSPISPPGSFGEFHNKDPKWFVSVFLNCDPSSSVLYIDGSVMLQLSNGSFLPSTYVGAVAFVGVLLTVYLLAFLAWGFRMYKYRSTGLLPYLHPSIFAMLCFAIIEYSTRLSLFHYWSILGVRPKSLYALSLCFQLFKEIVLPPLLVLLAMGWGVAATSLPRNQLISLFLVTVIYAPVHMSLTLIQALEPIPSSAKAAMEMQGNLSFLGFISTILYAVYYIWTFRALSQTTRSLRQQNQKHKLSIYISLTRLLSASLGFVALSILLQISDMYSADTPFFPTDHLFLLDWGWVEVVYLMAVVGVAYIWRPVERGAEIMYLTELNTLGGPGGPEDDAADEGDWANDGGGGGGMRGGRGRTDSEEEYGEIDEDAPGPGRIYVGKEEDMKGGGGETREGGKVTFSTKVNMVEIGKDETKSQKAARFAKEMAENLGL